jgi:hypothetical protein
MMKRTILGLALAGSIFGCASSGETGNGQSTTPTDEHAHNCQMCPMHVAGTTVAASDVEGGVALDFTSTGDVSELRDRVRHMAEMHNTHHASGDVAEAHEEHGEGDEAGAHACLMMPPATASVSELEGGVRLSLLATDPADITALRERAHAHADSMSRGTCPMRHDDDDPADGAHH